MYWNNNDLFRLVSILMWCIIEKNSDVLEQPNATICRVRTAKAVNKEFV